MFSLYGYILLQFIHLKIQPNKCEFLRMEVASLKHLITQDDVTPNTTKVDFILNFPQPENQRNIKSFLGLSGYYGRLILNLAKTSKPFLKLF